MTEITRITDQLHRAFYGEAWHGPAVMELLDQVSAARAATHPVTGAHSMWELVNHISVWLDAVRRRLLGEDVQLDREYDWPPVADSSDSAWTNTIHVMKQRQDELEKTVTALSDTALDRPWADGKSTAYFLIHGTIQHNLYHAGQIALLMRAQLS